MSLRFRCPECRAVNGVDEEDRGRKIQMQPGKTYVITLDSDDFDAYLRVESPASKGLIEDDDSGGNLNSRIDFRPDAQEPTASSPPASTATWAATV